MSSKLASVKHTYLMKCTIVSVFKQCLSVYLLLSHCLDCCKVPKIVLLPLNIELTLYPRD